MKKIAILGATGYIGKSLIYYLSLKKEFEVFPFARSIKKLNSFLNSINKKNYFKARSFSEFGNHKYDVVINCIGIGDPKEMKEAGFKLFEITEKFDNLILGYLKQHPQTKYINFSSGAVYGKSIGEPIDEKSLLILDVNNIDQGDCYAVSKINCEAKHRCLTDLNIIDIRLFSFFSRFMGIKNSGFLLSHIINAVNNKKVFTAVPEDFVRDFINPADLLNLIKLIIKKEKINDYFDAYSQKPISFFQLLKYFKNSYGLKCRISSDVKLISPTGSKNAYYSKNRKAEKLLGYEPEFSSLSGMKEEIKYLIDL
jgi:nucleoside-diphosphate-sugar epimerase